MTRRAKILTAAFFATIAAPVSAQSNGIPAEFPPSTFSGNQYVVAEPEPVVEDEPEPVVETAAAEPPAARPARNADVGAPIETVASIGTTRAAPTIRFTPEPAAAPAAPVAAPEPVAAPTPAPITMAEACEGRFGVQSRFINNATGEPIDCGPAPQVAADVTPEPRRMTLADACAEMADTGTVLIDAATSRAKHCCANCADRPKRRWWSCSTKHRAACAPLRWSDRTNAHGRRHGSPLWPAGRAALYIGPASVATQIKRPAGYDNVWNDGRLNPNRGLPRQQAAAPRPVGTGHQFVQVGTFGDHNNANRLGQRLAGLGLPVGIVNRGQMKLVVSGPFNDPAALRQALATVRSMGFSDAYTRN